MSTTIELPTLVLFAPAPALEPFKVHFDDDEILAQLPAIARLEDALA